MTMTTTDLSIIIVNWNSIGFLRDCVKSLRETVLGPTYEIIVIDNVSERDNSRQALTEEPEFKDVRVLLPDTNLGFVRANNLGAKYARGKVLLFLNPDTLALEGAIDRLYAALEEDPARGITGARQLYPDGTLQTPCVQPFPTLANQFLSIDALRNKWPTLPLWGIEVLYREPGVYDVDSVSGACLMIRREAFDQIGGFSQDYFMYAEETDLCYFARRAGWKVCHVGTAAIIHFAGQSTAHTPSSNTFVVVLIRESTHTLMTKIHGPVYAFLYRCGMLTSALLRTIPLGIPALLGHARSRAICGKWGVVARWAIGMEKWPQKLISEADQAFRRGTVEEV